MSVWRKWWREHSLTIFFSIPGLIMTGMGLYWGMYKDIIVGLGTTFSALVFYNFLSGPLKEVNKPEED